MKDKLKRSVQLGKLAFDLSRMKSDKKGKSEKHDELIHRLGYLHGLPQKFAQILSLADLGSGLESETVLTESKSSMDFISIKLELQKSCHAPLDEIFSFISPHGISASLGQVHQAQLSTGAKVAVKVQYPEIRSQLDLDLSMLKWIASPIGMKKGFEVQEYRREIETMLVQELDYRHEAEMLKQFGDYLGEGSQIVIPKVYADCSSESVLTMSWVEGDSFDEVKSWSKQQKKELAHLLISFFVRSCFEWQCLHSDPHPGNYRFSLNNHGQPLIGLLDFGCVKTLSDATVAAIKSLLSQLLNDSLTPQKLALFTLLLFQNSPILLLDEPDAGTDIKTLDWIIAKINRLRRHKTIVIVTHHLRLAKDTSDYAILMAYGEIIEAARAKKFFTTPDHLYTKYVIRMGC